MPIVYMKQTLQETTILYDTTFPTGTQIDYDSLVEMGIVCSITIPQAQTILDRSPVVDRLAVHQITFPPQTTFFYKKRNDQINYAAQRVPCGLLLTQPLQVAGIQLPASAEWSFVTSVEQRPEESGKPEELEANTFRATLLGVLQEVTEINGMCLKPTTHLTLNEHKIAWHYTEPTSDKHTQTETRGTLLDYRSFVEQALEAGDLTEEHYEALRFLATDYFKDTVEWSSTLLGDYYRMQGDTPEAVRYYRRAYRIAVGTKGARSTAVQQLDFLLSRLRVGASVVEKKYVLRRLYLINSLFIVVLFYVGIHLREEQVAFLAGFRPNALPYEWAGVSYAVLAAGCALIALYTGWRTWATWRRIGSTMLLLGGAALLYSMYILGWQRDMSLTQALLVYGPYVVLSLWINAYALMLRDHEILIEEAQ